MKIKFSATINGPVTCVQWVPDDYVAQKNEHLMEGDALPQVNDCSTWDGKNIQVNQDQAEANEEAMAGGVGIIPALPDIVGALIDGKVIDPVSLSSKSQAVLGKVISKPNVKVKS